MQRRGKLGYRGGYKPPGMTDGDTHNKYLDTSWQSRLFGDSLRATALGR